MNTDSIIQGLEPQLPNWLTVQRWFKSDDEPPKSARILDHEVQRETSPFLLWTLVETDDGATYQVPVGLRERSELGGVLLGHEHGEIGEVDYDGKTLVAYDALIDSTLGRVLFDVITDGSQPVKSVRPMGAEQSNTSLVFDNRLVLKVFRRLYEGANPDLEVTKALTDSGFQHVAPVVATWERGDHDLAVCQPYLWDGTEGWKLALASVRDFLGADTQGATSTAGSSMVPIDREDPSKAGGDFADEARRLGIVTAELHVALSESFGTTDFDSSTLVSSLEGSLDSVSEAQRPALQKMIDELRTIPSGQAGRSVRVHGDYHLGQTLRSVSGWYIFDFEGEPARPLTERTIPTSPAKDVTGLLRSFQYASAAGLFEQMPNERGQMEHLAAAWEERNREAFLYGYFSVDEVADLLPTDEATRSLLLAAFELEKAIYELGYERSYRPDWVAIPTRALNRLLG